MVGGSYGRYSIDDVKAGESVLRASREQRIDIPRQTLHDQINGKVVHGTKPGPKPLLSIAEETELLRSKSTGAPTKKRKTTAESIRHFIICWAWLSSRSAGAAPVGKDGEPEVSINSDECCVCFCTFKEDRREGTG